MEKFAVDLDKVLDEFEFNEDRAELLANILPKMRPPAPLSQVRHQNLAANYRCTPYEPINMAAADFATAPASRNKPVSEVPHQWNVKNTLQQPGSETDSEGSETDSEAPYSIPNNINETKHITFYDNNSFKDEFVENKPVFAGNPTFPDQVIETKWLQKSQDVQGNKKFGNSTNSSKVNVSGVFSSLNEYVNAGASSKMNVRDIKTVSNNLTINKIKNLDKNSVDNHRSLVQHPTIDIRNLPDVASTSNLPTMQSSAVSYDLPNNTFDLVTNLSSDQEVTLCAIDNPSKTFDLHAQAVEIGSAKSSENVEALNTIFKTDEIKNNMNVSTLQNTNNDIPNLVEGDIPREYCLDNKLLPVIKKDADVHDPSTLYDEVPCPVLNSEEGSQLEGMDLAESPKPKTVIGFTKDDNISDSDLLTYLQDLEEEFDQGLAHVEDGTTDSDANSLTAPVDSQQSSTAKPPESKDLTLGLNHFSHDLQTQSSLHADITSNKLVVQPNSDGVTIADKDNSHKTVGIENAIQNYKAQSADHLSLKDSEGRVQTSVCPENSLRPVVVEGEPCDESSGADGKAVNVGDVTANAVDPSEVTESVEDVAQKRGSSPTPAYVGDDSSPETSSDGDRPATEEPDSDATTSTEEDVEGSPMATEMPRELKRTGLSILEVRSPMVQSPRDGGTIHVLGEEERPTRPKYLFLPSRIRVGGSAEAGEAASSDEDGTVALLGPPGATPHACHATDADNNTVEENQNVVNASQALEGTPTLDPTATNDAFNATLAAADNANGRPTAEQLDNQANINLAADAGEDNLSSPDYSGSSVETASPPPIVLGPAEPGSLTSPDRTLGFVSPFWVPDNQAPACMLCQASFTLIRRRHHCRACGKVLCSKCSGLRARLEYMDNAEGRVCLPCHNILLRVLLEESGESAGSPAHGRGAVPAPGRQPHPNNPMDYCSTIPPLQQAAGAMHNPTPSVLVPVGVLKRQGSSRPRSDVAKQVMFSDGIRPGGDLTELDGSAEPRIPFRRPGRVTKRVATPPGSFKGGALGVSPLPPLDPKAHSYIPSEKGLPPIATLTKGELKLSEAPDSDRLMASLRSEEEPPLLFAINRNFFVSVKILVLSCCEKRTCWCFSTRGLRCVSQDEVMLVLEATPGETDLPRDVLCYFNTLYQDAAKGCTVSELGYTLLTGPFLGSTDHGAFVYIRPSFQCLHRLAVPSAPYLVAILVHRAEVPWARVFPIRLMLRLGAEYGYYPCSLVSVRGRRPVYYDVGHTIINLLADFRNLSYVLPSVRGLVIHMEDRQTTILMPRNGYDQVTRALNNSNEHVLALAANLSPSADSHLVCMQNEGDLGYYTQAIHSKPRKVTGASFVVFNGALKTSSNLTAKSSIVEDGLMVQITPDTMAALRTALRNMKDWSVGCGPLGAADPDETVSVRWVEDDKNFNVGVRSVIDGRSLDGVPSIRVHNGTDYLGRSRLVRWTEVFILQSEEGGGGRTAGDPLGVDRLSESIARAVCHALVKLLDLLAQADCTTFAVRAAIHPDNVSYEGGSRGEALPPIYMNSLDHELVPVLHAAASSGEGTSAVLELVFHVLLQ